MLFRFVCTEKSMGNIFQYNCEQSGKNMVILKDFNEQPRSLSLILYILNV